MMLHTPPLTISRYCVPTAIAAVTGCSREEVHDAIHNARIKLGHRAHKSNGHRMPIARIDYRVSAMALECLGYDVVQFSPRPRMTLNQFMEKYGNCNGPWIVSVTGHAIAVSHGEICDSHTRLPLEYAKWKNRRGKRHVKRWLVISPRSKPQATPYVMEEGRGPNKHASVP